jgi:hypothetical protein
MECSKAKRNENKGVQRLTESQKMEGEDQGARFFLKSIICF